MTSAAAAAAAASIYSLSSYALSPHAAPFNPPSRPACAPLECRQNGDVSRSVDASSVGYAEEKTSKGTHSASPVACALMKSSGAVYPPSTHVMHTGQPSSWSAVCLDAYPSSPYVSITSNYKQQNSLTSGNGSKCSTVRIERPPNKTSETNKNSCGSGSKLVIAENSMSNKDSEKETSSHILQFNDPVNGKDNSKGTMISSEEANPVFSASPLHIPTISADPCGVLAEDVMPDPSECSVDSPCYRGASASRLSLFDVFQTPVIQSTNQELEAYAVRQKQSSSTVQHHETPSELQSLVTKTNDDHCKSQTGAGASKKSGAISIKETKISCGKELECANQYAAKCELDQKHLLELRDNYVKRSGLNSAAPDFVPSALGKSKIGKGPCSSAGKNISGVLKAIENLTVVFQSSYSGDEIELDEDDYILLESVIDSLQTCLHKKRKDPIKGASDKAGPKAPHSQTTVLKSDAGKYNGSYIADGDKDIIINHFASSSHMHNGFGRNSLTRGQPALNNVQKKMSCEEEHPQVLVYKNLWIEAERANCELKYQLKHTCIKVDLESSMAPVGGPRKNYSQVSDLSTGPSNLYGFTLAHPTAETSGARNGQYLPYAGDCTQSGGDATLSCSSSTKGYTALPKNLQHGHVLTGLEETATHRHAPLPYRACQGLNDGGTLDGVTARSYITGQDSILRSNSKYGSSDWEHVLTEEIGWS